MRILILKVLFVVNVLVMVNGSHIVTADDVFMDVTTTIPDVVVDGECSLIEAIDNANADSAIHSDCPAGHGTDTIILQSDSMHMLTAIHNTTDGANGLPSITSPIIIEGNNASIERSENTNPPTYYRIFHIAASGDLTLTNVTIARGKLRDGSRGGGIYNTGILTLNSSTLSNNSLLDRGIGGGVYSTGSLTIMSSVFENNITGETGSGGGIFTSGNATISDTQLFSNWTGGSGGAITNTGILSITGSFIDDNYARFSGGGIWNSGMLSIHNTPITNNGAARNWGGGIDNASNGTLTITDSLIQGNHANKYWGGGIYSRGELTIENTIIDNNSGAVGSGLYLCGDSNLTHVQVSNNRTLRDESGGAIAVDCAANVTLNYVSVSNNIVNYGGAGIYHTGTGLVTINNSLIANNSGQTNFGNFVNAGVWGHNMLITNSTIYGNSNDTGDHSAVYAVDGTMTIQFTTIAQNGGSAVIVNNSQLRLHNSIVADGDCSVTGGSLDASGTTFTTGNCANFDADFTTVLSAQLNLQVLANNGGAVETVMPGAGSIASNVIAVADCRLTDGTALSADARGIARPQGSGCDAGAVEILCDTCNDTVAPTTTITLNPLEPDGLNGWYTASVQLSLIADDNAGGSGVDTIEWSIDDGLTWNLYTSELLLAVEGETTLLARSTDNAGNIESPPAQAIIPIDTLPPTVDISTDKDVYTRFDDVFISITSADTSSGVASLNAEFDGIVVNDGSVIDLFNYTPGIVSYSATVSDNAGWSATDSGQIEIVVTLDSLLAAIDYLWENGAIDNQGIYNSLRQKFVGALAAEARGQSHVVVNKLSALLNEVQAQSGQHITSDAANLLQQDINAILLTYGVSVTIDESEARNQAVTIPTETPIDVEISLESNADAALVEVTLEVMAIEDITLTDVPTNEPTVTETPTDVPTSEPTMTETPTDIPTSEPMMTETPSD